LNLEATATRLAVSRPLRADIVVNISFTSGILQRFSAKTWAYMKRQPEEKPAAAIPHTGITVNGGQKR
jgi:hypothetical protein